jgi:hypothetical protein
MVTYRHTQPGTLTLWILGGSVVPIASIAAVYEQGRWIALATAAILVAVMFLFASLTVEVTDEHVLVAFGPGLIRKRFPAGEIVSARVVTNPWYYGWGIHLTPHGWLYNISGFDAVEIELRSSRKVRIGTDEPRLLLAAVQRAMPRP